MTETYFSAKFGDPVTEAVWTLTLDGLHDDATGAQEAHGWFGLVILNEPEHVMLADQTEVIVPADNYIVSEDSQGFVRLSTFETESEARAEMDAAAEDYFVWLDQDAEGDDWLDDDNDW